MRRRALLVAALLLVGPAARAQEQAGSGDPLGVVGRPKGQALNGEALLARTEDVAGLLRCPVCQGLSVADSPATMAVNMKAQVREMLAAGYDQEQILAFWNQWGERTNPEKQCAVPSPSPSIPSSVAPSSSPAATETRANA